MPDAMEGVIHGKTIELTTDPGLAEGQTVRVNVRPLQTSEQTREAILRTSGSMANNPDFDSAMAQVESDRRAARYRETAG
ncbi:MAG: hypothetical protein ACP5XB_24395 [Isosphaeraceae bacterium]